VDTGNAMVIGQDPTGHYGVTVPLTYLMSASGTGS